MYIKKTLILFAPKHSKFVQAHFNNRADAPQFNTLILRSLFTAEHTNRAKWYKVIIGIKEAKIASTVESSTRSSNKPANNQKFII